MFVRDVNNVFIFVEKETLIHTLEDLSRARPFCFARGTGHRAPQRSACFLRGHGGGVSRRDP